MFILFIYLIFYIHNKAKMFYLYFQLHKIKLNIFIKPNLLGNCK